MKTYANILDNMNAKVKQLEQDVQKLENNFTNTEDIMQYLLTYNLQIEIEELDSNFLLYHG
jgi:hypothetical protein